MKSTILRVALVAALSTAVAGYADAGQTRHPGGGGGGHSAPSGGGGGGGGGAVPRGSGGGGSAPSAPSSAGRSNSGSSAPSGQGAVRRYPGGVYRGGAPVGRGYAIPRPWRPGGDYNFYRIRPYGWYYNPWGWGTFGFGYIWDPFWWGYPYGGWGYPYGGYYGGYGGGYVSQDFAEDKGGLRLKVKPSDAEVLVDNYFYGTVSDYDGAFQKLKLEKGAHNVEIRKEGFEPLTFKVFIVAGETITYKGNMRGAGK